MIRWEVGQYCQNSYRSYRHQNILSTSRIFMTYRGLWTWVWHPWLGSTCTDLTCVRNTGAMVIKDYEWQLVEGGCDMGVNSTFLRQTQASPGWIYRTSLLFTPAGPLLHKNETTAFMTDREGTEVASCRDEGILFTLGCCQTTAKFITSSQDPLGPFHLVILMNGFAN